MADPPKFIETDPAVIEQAAIATYEAALGKTLQPGQPERLLINAAVYREALKAREIQHAGEQSLVNFATGEHLEQLGILLGVERLQPSAPTTTIRFTRTILTNQVTIPIGTLVTTPSGILARTDADLVLRAGDNTAAVTATLLVIGPAQNGIDIDQFTELVTPLPDITLRNTDITAGGADLETDEALRTRIKLAPGRFSTAGSRLAYEFWTRTASPSIIDAVALHGGSVRVDVYVLLNTGLPNQALLDDVGLILNDDRVRPLTDSVSISAPTEVSYALEASVVLFQDAEVSSTLAAVQAAADAYLADRRLTLGADIVRSQIIDALSVDGVYSVSVISPAADIVLDQSQWANGTGATITEGGLPQSG